MNDMMNNIAMLLAGAAPRPASPVQPAPVMNSQPAVSRSIIIPGWDDHDPPVIVNPNDKGGRKKKKPLSPYEKKVEAAALKGPSAYTTAMRRNIGMNKPTIGYGNPTAENTSGFTNLMNLFAPQTPNGGNV
jgi:hypothetical protein